GPRAAGHRRQPGLRSAERPGGAAAARLRGPRRTVGGAALVAGADPASVRGGPPLAGQRGTATGGAARAAVAPRRHRSMTRIHTDHPLVQVETDAAGTPTRLRMDGTDHGELGICNRWRVDDGWWREPVARS